MGAIQRAPCFAFIEKILYILLLDKVSNVMFLPASQHFIFWQVYTKLCMHGSVHRLSLILCMHGQEIHIPGSANQDVRDLEPRRPGEN